MLSEHHRVLLVLNTLHCRHLKFVDAVIASAGGFGDLEDSEHRRHTLLVCHALIAGTSVSLVGMPSAAGLKLLNEFEAIAKKVKRARADDPLLGLPAVPSAPRDFKESDWPAGKDMATAARQLERASVNSHDLYPLAGKSPREQKDWLHDFACYGRSGLCGAFSELLQDGAAGIHSSLVKFVLKHENEVLDQAQAFAVDDEHDAIEAALEAFVRSDVWLATDLDLNGTSIDSIRSVVRALIPQIHDDDIEVVHPQASPAIVELSIDLTLRPETIRAPASTRQTPSPVGRIVLLQQVRGSSKIEPSDVTYIGRDTLSGLIKKVSQARQNTKKQIETLGSEAA